MREQRIVSRSPTGISRRHRETCDGETDRKNDAERGSSVEDLECVVTVRKYRLWAAEYAQLAKEFGMPTVRNLTL